MPAWRLLDETQRQGKNFPQAIKSPDNPYRGFERPGPMVIGFGNVAIS
ncbi:MAG: hypothetical protein OQL06_06340 [Gammaproteobacteria bacterium]|nr:hypothetical protein [Gammaproteobacteria bacterium]